MSELEADGGSRLKSEFLRAISRTMSESLTSIKGFSELLLHGFAGEINKEQREHITHIYHATKKLLSLVEDIDDQLSVEKGSIILSQAEIDALEIINFIHEEFTEDISRIKIEIPPDIGCVVADEKEIKKLFRNLISNALAATTDDGSITLSARLVANFNENPRDFKERDIYPPPDNSILKELTSKDPVVEFSVQDSGKGITSEDRESLFKPFSQLDSVYKGLPISKMIVERHHGVIWFESKPDGGNAVTFVIPANKEGTKT